jgi:phage terminase small subunit
MARPRTPTKLLEQRGAFKHDPQRKERRQAEPKPTGALGEPPEYFTDELHGIWCEMETNCPVGVLTNADRWLVELACQLMLKFRTIGLLPKVGMTGAELSQLVICLSRMGMTPADRSRVGVSSEQTKQQDDWEQLAADFPEPKPN